MHDGPITDVAHAPSIGWLPARSRQMGMSTLLRAVTKLLPIKSLVLSGVCGTHLHPLTHTAPKLLILIANKPNIPSYFEDLREAGIADIGIILGNVMPEKVQEFRGDGIIYFVPRRADLSPL